MKVLYFTFGYSTHDHRFVSAIKACGHDVYYMNLKIYNPLEIRSLPYGIKFIPWWGNRPKISMFDYPKLIHEFKTIVKSINPDIIHTGPLQTVAPIAILSGFTPIVSMSWGSDLLLDADKNVLNKIITRQVLKNSKALIGDCQAVMDKAVSYGFPKERVTLFPWGIDLGHFTKGNNPKLRSDLGWDDDFIILSSRSWEPVYGVETVIEAFCSARKLYSDLKLILLGNGSLKDKILDLISKYELHDHIHLGGRVNYDQLPAYYWASDLYVSASKSDGSSVSLLEAMACQVPVAVSEIPGNREWIIDGSNGWLFKYDDVSDLVRAISKIREAGSSIDGMAALSRKKIVDNANWNANYKKINDAYHMALS